MGQSCDAPGLSIMKEIAEGYAVKGSISTTLFACYYASFMQ
jgi:hypothetical protein